MRIVLDETIAPAVKGISRGVSAVAAWWRQLLLLALLALAAGCNSNDPFRNYAGAVGPDLYTRQTVQNTSLLNAYTSSICAQAGLYTTASGGCTLSTPADWKTFVDMGLYDIDQRCDTFLDGLYYKEKSTGPILAQISNTRSFTRAVLEATKTSNVAIWIVAAAFDLTEATFRNSRTSLLEALDPTTVKSIVFKRQQEVKKEIYRSTISSKPQALHALRTYLRVCMPFTIEMEANAILTSVQRTGEAGNSPIVFDAAKFREELKSTPDTRADDRIPRSPTVTKTSQDMGRIEDNMAPAVHRQIANAICAPGVSTTMEDFGPQGSPVRQVLEAWESEIANFEPGIQPNGTIDTVSEDKLLLATIRSSNAYRCGAPESRARTTYEVAVLASPEQRTVWQERILSYLGGIEGQDVGRECKAAEARQALVAAFGADGKPDGAFGPASRTALKAAKLCLLKSPSPPAINQTDELEPILLEALQ